MFHMITEERKKRSGQTSKEVDMPDVILCFYDNFIIEDHQEKRFYLVANGQTKVGGYAA